MAALQILSTRPSRSYCGDGSLTRGNRFTVRNNRTGSYDNSSSRHLCAPANVEVFAKYRNQRVESPKNRKQICSDESGAAGSHKDVSLEVLLSVVDFTNFNALLYRTKAVGHLARVQQDERIVVVHELWRDNACIRSVRRLD
jgi:hypothetical protein